MDGAQAAGQGLFDRAAAFAALQPEGSATGPATAVAKILADWGLDAEVRAAALLLGAGAPPAVVRRRFGDGLGDLVEGAARLAVVEHRFAGQDAMLQLQNYFRAGMGDPRILLLKLADRLHQMRTLSDADRAARTSVARETMDVFVPLAERIGLHQAMSELETLAFRILDPDAALAIERRFDALRVEEAGVADRIAAELTAVLRDAGVEAEVSAHERSTYAIYRKVAERNLPLGGISDGLDFRILLQHTADCYRALGAVQARWAMVPGGFKDYISTPKRNGYRALHTMIHADGRRLKLRFGTAAMLDGAQPGSLPGAGLIDDLVELADIQDAAIDVLDETNWLFAFTPGGNLIRLPNGASPVDFAYAVHTDLGHHAAGARINGAIVPLHAKIALGDEVEIMPSTAQEPEEAWLAWAVTRKARTAILRHLREKEPGRDWSEEAAPGGGLQPVSTRAAERLLARVASPRIIVSDGRIDAEKGAFEQQGAVPLEWLPGHLRNCAAMLRDGLASNAPDLLRTPLDVYIRSIDDNPHAPIVQTLSFAATMIGAAMAQMDFDIWANGLDENFRTFLKDHERLVAGFPELAARQAVLAQLPVDFSADVGGALSEFVATSRRVLTQLVEAGVATERARDILQQQLDLAQSVVHALPGFEAPEPAVAPPGWSPVHEQAANNLGVWIQVRDNLSFLLAVTAHPQVQALVPMLADCITRFIGAVITLLPK